MTHVAERIPPAASVAVAVDVGDGVGACVLYCPEALAGSEVEISPLGDDHARAHAWVQPRRQGGGVVHAAVYPALPQGGYRIWRGDGGVALEVDVRAGAVTQARWPAR